MIVLPKGERTRFEDSVMKLRACTVCFELIQTLQEDEYDENIYQLLLDEILERYRFLCNELEEVFASLHSDKPPVDL